MTEEIISAVSEVNRLRKENKELQAEIIELRQTRTITKAEAKLLRDIQKAKIELKKQDLKKSGYNSHNKYQYFELDDFLPCLEVILDKRGLASFFFFEGGKANLVICNEEGVKHTWTTRCVPAKARENGYDVGVHMKSEQAIQTYARRTLWLQAMEITEPNSIEADGKQDKKQEKPKKQKVTADKIIKPVRNKKTEEVTAERIQDILKEAHKRFDEAQEDKPEDKRRPWIWENAKYIIRKHCRNEQEFEICKQATEFTTADHV